jgi:hypothetical protein
LTPIVGSSVLMAALLLVQEPGKHPAFAQVANR